MKRVKVNVYVKSDKEVNVDELSWYKEVDKTTKRQQLFVGEGMEVLSKYQDYKLKETLKTLKETLKEVDLTPEEWLYYNISRGTETEVEPCIYKIELELDEVLPNFIKIETEGLDCPLATPIMLRTEVLYLSKTMHWNC